MRRISLLGILAAQATLCAQVQLPVPSTTNCVVPPPGLVSWWDAEQLGADVLGRNPGTFENDVRVSTGLVGRAFEFRQGAYVQVRGSESLQITNAITLEAWVNHYALPEGYVQRYLTLTIEKAQLRFDRGFQFALRTESANFNSIRSDLTVSTSRWYHVVGTYDGQWQRLYVNGVEARAVKLDGTLYPMHTEDFRISTPEESMNGLIDDPRVYNRALTAAEIRELSQGEICLVRMMVPRLTDDGVNFLVNGRSVRIEVSMDLKSWSQFLRFETDDGFEWIEQPLFKQRFFRAVMPAK
jgi:hypothetical protein